MMAQFQPQGGLLIKHPDLLSLHGKKVKMLEEPWENNGFWNVRVELPDGSKWLGSVSNKSGENLAKVWGYEMANWVEKEAYIIVGEAQGTGKPFLVFTPHDPNEADRQYDGMTQSGEEKQNEAAQQQDIPSADEVGF